MRRETSDEARMFDRSSATDRRATFVVVTERYLLDPDPRRLQPRGGRFWLCRAEKYTSDRTEKRQSSPPQVRSPSTRTAGLVTLGLSFATAAAAGLHAPTGVWIGT